MKNFKLKSVTGRLVVGKTIGLVFGIFVMAFLTIYDYPFFSYFGLSMLLLFTLMGVLVAFMGQYDRHPYFNFKLSWWMSSVIAGVLLSLMFVLSAYSEIKFVLGAQLFTELGFHSPFWFLVDGTIVALIMGYLQKRFCGYGEKLELK